MSFQPPSRRDAVTTALGWLAASLVSGAATIVVDLSVSPRAAVPLGVTMTAFASLAIHAALAAAPKDR